MRESSKLRGLCAPGTYHNWMTSLAYFSNRNNELLLLQNPFYLIVNNAKLAKTDIFEIIQGYVSSISKRCKAKPFCVIPFLFSPWQLFQKLLLKRLLTKTQDLHDLLKVHILFVWANIIL